jgi:hypothetical protein
MKINPFSLRTVILILLMCFMSSSVMAQKVSLDTLGLDQLNLYKDKAVKIRNTGRALTLSGGSVMVTCIIIGVIALYTPPDEPSDCRCGPWVGLFYVGLVGVAGMATTIAGIPLWAVGGSRKAKAELTLQKFNIAPENSMAVGLGITLRF